MFPAFFGFYTANSLLANAKQVGQISLSKARGSNLRDIGNGKFAVLFVSSLMNHILHILRMGSHGEMFGINARGVVARMHDLHSIRDGGLVFDHPSNAVSHVHFSPVVINTEKSLANLVLGSHPRPAFIGGSLVNFVPKALKKLFVKHESTYMRVISFSS